MTTFTSRAANTIVEVVAGVAALPVVVASVAMAETSVKAVCSDGRTYCRGPDCHKAAAVGILAG